MSGIAHGGNGRLWERFELANINDRIENIYQYFLNVSQQQHLNGAVNGLTGTHKQQLIDRMREGIRNELNDMIKDLETKYNELTKKGTNLNIKLRTELDKSRNEVKDLKHKIDVFKQKNKHLSNKNELLKAGNDKIKNNHIQRLQQQTRKLSQQLRDCEHERKKEQKEHEAAKKEFERVIQGTNNVDTKAYQDEIALNIADKNRLKREKDDLQKRFNKLDEEYKALWNKYDFEKTMFKEAIEKQQIGKAFKEKEQQKLINLRDELTKEFQQKLKQREDEWKKSRNQSVTDLDKKFKELEKLHLENRKKKDSILEEKEGEIDRLEKEIKKLKTNNKKLRDANETITDLKTELSKYKILWQHFLGLDGPLKEEIEKVNNKLDKFENHHSIQSPIPRKKRRVILQSLDQWKSMGHHDPPLTADIDDRHQRIELYNMTKNKVLELQGFYLENQDGMRIKIDSRQINPGKSIDIALKKRGAPHHQQFCKFTEDAIIYLCDRFGERMQIFPITEVVYDDLSIFDEDKCPLMIQHIFNEDENFRGFEFVNATKKRIKLKNMYFKNKKGPLHLPIPFEVLTKTGKIRLVVTDDPNHPRLGRNDLRVSPNVLPRNLSNDVLILCDEYGNEMELYNMNGVELNSVRSSSSTSNSECYIM